MKNQIEIDPRRALRLVHDIGYRQAEATLGYPRSTLFDLRTKYPFLYEGLDKPDIDEALLNLISEPIHPAAHNLPLWPLDQLVAAAEELTRTGKLAEPIQRIDGKIADGRNRRLICLFADLLPEFEDIDLPSGMSVEEYVEQRNVLRRQLSRDQLIGHAAVRYVKMRVEGKEKRSMNLLRGTTSDVQKIADRGSSLEFLAKLYGVNHRYIQEATKIMELDPILFRQLRKGKVSMADARRKCGLSEPKPKKQTTTETASEALGSIVFEAGGGTLTKATKFEESTETLDLRPRLLSLARAIEETCEQVPEELKSQLISLLKLAKDAIRDFEQ